MFRHLIYNIYILKIGILNLQGCKLKDILKLLNYTNLKKALYSSFIDEKNKKTYSKLKVYPSRGTSPILHKYTIFIDEAGLYKLFIIII